MTYEELTNGKIILKQVEVNRGEWRFVPGRVKVMWIGPQEFKTFHKRFSDGDSEMFEELGERLLQHRMDLVKPFSDKE